MTNMNLAQQNSPLAPHDIQEKEKQAADIADQQMQALANEVAQRSSNRIQKFEEGQGVISKSDGH